MLIHHLLERSAAADPDRPLLLAGGRQIPYGEIDRDAGRTAVALSRAGVAPGDRVALLAENSAFYVAAYYGISKLGAIAVCLNTAGDAALLAALLDDCTASVLLATRRHAATASAVAARVPSIRLLVIEADGTAYTRGVDTVTWASFVDGTDGAPLDASSPSDLAPAMIVYTSGSTGRPRGATLSHRNVVANTRSIVEYLHLDADDRVMDVLPFHYVYGKSLLNTHVAVGGSLVVEESLLFPDAVIERMIETRVTGFAGVPSTFAILLGRSSLAERSFPDLRYVTQAGGAMPVEHIRRLMDALPGKDIYIMYGATEASARLAYLHPTELPRRIGSIGRAIPGVEIRLIDESGREATPGRVGEIVARGDNVMLGYWNDEEETRAVMSEHGLHTGDLARADEEGFLYIVGRKRDMIKAGANRVAAREIEDAIVQHPDVEEAAVIGVPDELLGEAIDAFVTARAGAEIDGEAIVEFLRERVASYKVPKRVECVRELPRTGSGKVDKEALRRRRSA